MKIRNVLSLFDGVSIGQLALNKAGIKFDKYYASEINVPSIRTTQYNFPKTIQLGSVVDVKKEDVENIDLLIGGSPCQGFSFAGKGLNFEDPRSKLFFEYIRLLKELKPKYFFLENVKMLPQHKEVIDQQTGYIGVEINSNLVSAQNRRRVYWTNIPFKNRPKDKQIFLKDIIQFDVKGILTDEYIKNRKSMERWGNHFATINKKKSNTVIAIGKTDAILLTDLKRFLTPIEWERLQTMPDDFTKYYYDKDGNKKSNGETARYEMIGNSWTTDIISWFFSFMNGEINISRKYVEQLKLF